MITTTNNRLTYWVTGDNPQLLEDDLNAAVGLAERGQGRAAGAVFWLPATECLPSPSPSPLMSLTG
jgi:hypothetical protein